MRVRLKGLNWYRKRLANGEIVTGYYAWRGGPRLTGEPGTPEFMASYNAALSARITAPPGVLQGVITKYQESDAYIGLAERTRRDYARHIVVIEREFGDLPVTALSEPRTRTVILDWRDRLAEASDRQADYALSVLSSILSWALDRSLVPANPCKRPGLKYAGGARADKVWSAEDEQAFYATAPAHMHLPLLMALWTGQRQGDLLRLKWFAYDGTRIRLVQQKSLRRRRSGKKTKPVRVVIKVGAPLKAALDAARVGKKAEDHILINSRGEAWTSDGFRTSWAKACTAAGIEGLTFHDLRGTAVTRLAECGCTEPEIATVTGHKLSGVRAILDHYLNRSSALADSAIGKLEKGTNSQAESQAVSECSGNVPPKNQ